MRTRWAWPLTILAAALALRLILFTGIQGTDDLLYSAQASSLTRGEWTPGGDLFSTRLGYVVPIALLFTVFGVHPGSLVLLSLASSMLLIGLAWKFGKDLYGDEVGRVAAVLVALLPLDIFYATEGHADLTQAALATLGLYLLWSALREPEARRALRGALLAGAAFGLAHLVKESAFLIFLPSILWMRDRQAWPRLAAAMGIFAAVVAAEMVFYGVLRGDALLRVHLALRQVEVIQIQGDSGFWARGIELARTFLDPRCAGFPFLGAFSWTALMGAIHALRRDRDRSGWIVLWVLGVASLIAFWPLTLLPYRPALSLFPRFFAVIVVPGALLSAHFFVEVFLRERPSVAWTGGVIVGLFSLLCAVQLHQDGVRWRRGAEWAHEALARHPGSVVVADSRTTQLLRFMSGYAPTYDLRSYRTGDPPPPVGTLLLDNERWVAANASWDLNPPPAWWRTSPPRRERIDGTSVLPHFRLRGSRGAAEQVLLSRVLPE